MANKSNQEWSTDGGNTSPQAGTDSTSTPTRQASESVAAAEPELNLELPQIQQGIELRRSVDKATAQGDTELRTSLMHEEWLNMASSVSQARVQGQDPIRNVSPEARNVSAEVAQSFMVPELAVRGVRRDEIFKAGKDDPRVQIYNKYAEMLAERKKGAMRELKAGMSVFEQRQVANSYERVPIDEGDEQELLNFLNEMDAQAKEQDPSFSVSDDPLYAKMLRSISPTGDLEATQPGEEMATSAIGRTTRAMGRGLLSGVTQVGGQVGDGLAELGFLMLGGIDGPYYEAWKATKGPDKFIVDKDGNIQNNGGKIGREEAPYVLFQMMTGLARGDIEKEARKYREMVDWDNAQVQEGAERYANVTASVLGGLGSFLLTGGGQILNTTSRLMSKGSALMLAGQGARTQRLGQIASQVGGLGVGTGIWEMGIYGQAEGYGKTFLEGMKMGPVFWVMGKIGKHTEKALATRTKMPKPARNFTAGILEGLTLSTSEAMHLTSSLWDFMRNPDDPEARATWLQGLVGNMLGMGMFKAATGSTPFELKQLRETVGEEGAAGVTAGKAEARARTKAATEGDVAAAQRFGVKPETFEIYTQKTREFQAEPTAERQGELREIEKQLDVEKAGKDITPEQRAEETSRLKTRTVEELQKLPQEKKVDEIIDRLLGPKGYATSAEAKRAAAMKRAETVGEAEGGRKVEQRQVEGVKPKPEKQMIQEGGKEGLRPERFREKTSREAEKEAEAGRDPLEDPSIRQKLTPEQFQEVAGQRTGRERRIAAEKYLGPERRVGERREAKEKFLEAEDVPGPRKGQPKSLRLRPELQVEAIEGAKDVRQRDILKLMEGLKGDPVQVPIRKGVAIKGRLSTKGIMGWYEQQGQQIRLRGARDIVTSSHEWAHAMERAAENAGKWNTDMAGPLLGELAKAASTYPGYAKLPPRTRIAEGWAEYWAREMLGDPVLAKEVPMLHDFMQKWISQPGMEAFRRQHDVIQQQLKNYFDIGATRRVRMSWIGASDKPTEAERMAIPKWNRLKRLGEGFTKYMLDDVAPMKAAQRKWLDQAGQKASDLPLAANPTKLIDAYRMTAMGQSKKFLEEGTFDLAGNKTGESLKDITKDFSPKELDDFTTYMVARRAVDQIERSERLVMEGKLDKPMEMPFAKADATEAVRQLETPEFVDAAVRIREWADRLLDYATEAGSISPEERMAMSESNPVYVPFQRVLEGAKRVRGGRGIAEKGTGIGRLKGAQEEIRDPWEAMKDTTLGVITKAQQSMVMRAMYLQTKLVPGTAGFVTEIPRAAEPRKIMLERLQEELQRIGKKRGVQQEARDALEEMIELVAGGSENAALTFFFQKTTPTGSRPIIAYKPNFTPQFLETLTVGGKKLSPEAQAQLAARSGKLTWLEVDPEAYGILMGLDAPRLFLDSMPPALQKVISLPTQAVRWGATMFNPEFIARNIFRDAFSRQLFTRGGEAGATPVIGGFMAMGKGIMERVKNTPQAEIYRNLGLGSTSRFATEIARDLADSPSTIAKFGRQASKFFDAPEKWLRTKEFKDTYDAAKAEGKPDWEASIEAMLASKEVTVNFTRAGMLSRQLNQVLPYFSPAIAGQRKFWRTLAGAEGKAMRNQAMARGLLNIGSVSALVWWMGKDEDWYQDLPDYKRTLYWNFKFPGTDQITSIPKPFEPGLLFGSMVEGVLGEGMARGEWQIAEDTLLTMVGDLMVGYPWIPAGLLPLSEWQSGYSHFRKQPVLPAYMSETRLPEDQYTAYTSKYAKALGKMFGVSPAKLEYAINQYSGGMWRQIGNLGAFTEGVANAEVKIGRLPVIGTLFRQEEHKQSRAVDELYDTQKHLRQMSGSGELDLQGQRLQDRVNSAVQRIRAIRRNDRLSQDEKNRRSFEIAQPVVKETRRKL